MEMTVEARERRLRRLARANGMRLMKSRCRTPSRVDYLGFMLVDDRNCVVAGAGAFAFSMQLDDVEAWFHG